MKIPMISWTAIQDPDIHRFCVTVKELDHLLKVHSTASPEGNEAEKKAFRLLPQQLRRRDELIERYKKLKEKEWPDHLLQYHHDVSGLTLQQAVSMKPSIEWLVTQLTKVQIAAPVSPSDVRHFEARKVRSIPIACVEVGYVKQSLSEMAAAEAQRAQAENVNEDDEYEPLEDAEEDTMQGEFVYQGVEAGGGLSRYRTANGKYIPADQVAVFIMPTTPEQRVREREDDVVALTRLFSDGIVSQMTWSAMCRDLAWVKEALNYAKACGIHKTSLVRDYNQTRDAREHALSQVAEKVEAYKTRVQHDFRFQDLTVFQSAARLIKHGMDSGALNWIKSQHVDRIIFQFGLSRVDVSASDWEPALKPFSRSLTPDEWLLHLKPSGKAFTPDGPFLPEGNRILKPILGLNDLNLILEILPLAAYRAHCIPKKRGFVNESMTNPEIMKKIKDGTIAAYYNLTPIVTKEYNTAMSRICDPSDQMPQPPSAFYFPVIPDTDGMNNALSQMYVELRTVVTRYSRGSAKSHNAIVVYILQELERLTKIGTAEEARFFELIGTLEDFDSEGILEVTENNCVLPVHYIQWVNSGCPSTPVRKSETGKRLSKKSPTLVKPLPAELRTPPTDDE